MTYVRDRFEAISTFAEKDIAKGAGFRWDPTGKRWWTTDVQRAQQLADYCDDLAAAHIRDAKAHAAASIEASRAVDVDLDIPSPEGLEYLPFQRAGIAYASARTNTLLADEMGLGKTIQALGVINADPSVTRVLVICPASLKLNWRREAQKWLVRPCVVEIGDAKRVATEPVPGMILVTVVNYDILRKQRAALRSVTWDVLIADEAHYLKSHKAQRTHEVLGKWDADPQKRLAAIPAKRRMYLTGTPIVNRPIELWPLLHSVGWKNWQEYVTRYCGAYRDNWGWQLGGASHLDELQEKFRASIMVRRLKRNVLTELPPKRRQVLVLPANGAGGVVDAERTSWQGHQSRLADLQAAVELAKAGDSDSAYEDAVRDLRQGWQVAFTEMSRVRHETALAKVPHVVEHAVQAVDESGRLVIFAHHHDVVAGIREGLTAAGIASVQLTGEDSMEARQAAIDAFQAEGGPAVFVGSIQAAGVGITLTQASHVVFAELDWVPGNMSQAEDRLHRIGQTESVLVQHLVLDESLDAQLAQTLVEKQAVIDAALDNPTARKHEPAFGSLLTVGDPATRKTSRADVTFEAESISPQEIAEVHGKLRILAGLDGDGAQIRNDVGFNKFDSSIGHSLASQETLTARQAALGRKLVQKYRRQLGG